jgi:hypothetical protein
MKTFLCQCNKESRLFFENTLCSKCGRMVGYCPDEKRMQAFEPINGTNKWQSVEGHRLYRQCSNYVQHNVCNWMIPDEKPQSLCIACQFTDIIPNLDEPRHLVYWARLETAKRRLLYTLSSLNLPVVSKNEDPEKGLLFRFLADKRADSEFTEPLNTQEEPVYTGHKNGIITINLAEADDIARTRARVRMAELYRTLQGHFRHEIGHYYWELLISPYDEKIQQFRALFGNEQTDYKEAQKIYYEQGVSQRWNNNYISAYGAMHPLEDWAETWAHYFHIIDCTETARDFGFIVQQCSIASQGIVQEENEQLNDQDGEKDRFNILLDDWVDLSVGINALNRSMGIEDFYPFVLHEPIKEKLRFIHQVILPFIKQKWIKKYDEFSGNS